MEIIEMKGLAPNPPPHCGGFPYSRVARRWGNAGSEGAFYGGKPWSWDGLAIFSNLVTERGEACWPASAHPQSRRRHVMNVDLGGMRGAVEGQLE
jgi:hypothetical protein